MNRYLRIFAIKETCTVIRPTLMEISFVSLASLAGIGLITYLSYIQGTPLLIASFGASACIIFTTPSIPAAQPRNVICSHLIASLIGIIAYKFLGNEWYTTSLGVALTISLMLFTQNFHPPAGATSIIAIIGCQDWMFILMPVGAGVLILVLCGILINNIKNKNCYPTYWF